MKRKHSRLPYIRQITVITQDEKTFISKSGNLSPGGIFLVTGTPMPVGTNGFVLLLIDSDEKNLEIKTRFSVCHHQATESGDKGMGLKFHNMSESDQQALKEYLDAIESSQK